MKEVYAWQPEYNVHVKALDAQHQRLFSLIGELQGALEQGRGASAAERIFPQLVAYTQYHFREEERLMEKYDFPGLPEHRLQHEVLTRRVLLFKKSHEEGKGLIPVSLLLFLREWLVTHILGSDRKYGDFFNDKGVC